MVVGGNNFPTHSAYFDVELIDLSGQERTCRKPANYPGAAYGSVGAYFKDKAFVCGGYHDISDCYYYNPNGTWTQGPSMTAARQFATATIFNQNFWITGGENSNGGLATTELFDSGRNSFVPFVNLPEERYYHNLISIDDNRSMILGGQDPYQDTFIFNGVSWQEGPMLSRERWISQAGLITFQNGTQIILAAGGRYDQTTEFLNVEDDKWHFGPDLPYDIYGGASVQLENTFLIAGGYSIISNAYLDTIWSFDTEVEEWTLLNEHLTIGRLTTAAFLVPDEFC